MSQAESLRNLIVSEVADWQVLTLRLAVQLQALKNSTQELDGSVSNYKQVSGCRVGYPLFSSVQTGKQGVVDVPALYYTRRFVRWAHAYKFKSKQRQTDSVSGLRRFDSDKNVVNVSALACTVPKTKHWPTLTMMTVLMMAMVQLARDALLVHGPLAHRLGVHQLRNELETVAFRRLFPQQFNEVSSGIRPCMHTTSS